MTAPVQRTDRGPARRHWAGVGGGVVAVVALVALARAGAPPAAPPPATAGDTITYEITGPARAVDIRYGDIFDLIFSPYVATTVDHAALPWRLTVPFTEPVSLHDLTARSAAPGDRPLTCTVRRGDVVVSTSTAVGEVGCDTTPAAAALTPGR